MGRAIKPETFNKVKVLSEAGISTRQITDILGISQSSISYIKKSKSLEDYRAIRKELRAERVKREAESTISIEEIAKATVAPTPVKSDIQILLENIKDWHSETDLLLHDLKKRLEFIENNMDIPIKKRLFR